MFMTGPLLKKNFDVPALYIGVYKPCFTLVAENLKQSTWSSRDKYLARSIASLSEMSNNHAMVFNNAIFTKDKLLYPQLDHFKSLWANNVDDSLHKSMMKVSQREPD